MLVAMFVIPVDNEEQVVPRWRCTGLRFYGVMFHGSPHWAALDKRMIKKELPKPGDFVPEGVKETTEKVEKILKTYQLITVDLLVGPRNCKLVEVSTSLPPNADKALFECIVDTFTGEVIDDTLHCGKSSSK